MPPRFLLSEGEELLSTFRPHAMSRFGTFLLGLPWLLYASAGAWAARGGPQWPIIEAGAFVFTLLALLHILVARWLGRGGVIEAITWTVAGLGLGVATWPATAVPREWGWAATLGLGLLASLVSVLRADFIRRRRVYFLTDRRLVIQDGVRRRTERTLPLESVENVQGHQGILGQMFSYGTVELVLEKKMKKDAPARIEALPGVPRYVETKHLLQNAVTDAKLPMRERNRRAEERRLKGSMEALASYMGRRPGVTGP